MKRALTHFRDVHLGDVYLGIRNPPIKDGQNI